MGVVHCGVYLCRDISLLLILLLSNLHDVHISMVLWGTAIYIYIYIHIHINGCVFSILYRVDCSLGNLETITLAKNLDVNYASLLYESVIRYWSNVFSTINYTLQNGGLGLGVGWGWGDGVYVGGGGRVALQRRHLLAEFMYRMSPEGY